MRQDTRERDYRAHRSAILAMLRSKFPGVPDHEEIYQEAWADALEHEARGGDLTDPGGLLRTLAWRRARDRLRLHRPEILDPTSSVLQNQPDPSLSPDEQVQVRVDAAMIRRVAESLDEQQAAVIKLRYERHLTSREIQRALGVKPKRLENIVTEAYKRVERALAPSPDGESEWRRHQRSLLVLCETGLATTRQRAQAQRMVADDPACRAMLAEIRSTLDRIAALLPMPVVLADPHGRIARLPIAVSDRLAAARDQLAELSARLSGHGSTLEQASSGGLAGMGTTAAFKAALACFTLAGGTVVCVDTGVFRHSTHPVVADHRHHKKRPPPPAAVTRPIALHRPATPPPKRPAARHAQRAQPPTTTNASAPPPPSPAPPGSTEFGPGAVGSQPASSTPAAAPRGGGGEFAP